MQIANKPTFAQIAQWPNMLDIYSQWAPNEPSKFLNHTPELLLTYTILINQSVISYFPCLPCPLLICSPSPPCQFISFCSSASKSQLSGVTPFNVHIFKIVSLLRSFKKSVVTCVRWKGCGKIFFLTSWNLARET